MQAITMDQRRIIIYILQSLSEHLKDTSLLGIVHTPGPDHLQYDFAACLVGLYLYSL